MSRQDRPRSTKRRALAAAIASSALGAVVITGGIASGSTVPTPERVTVAASRPTRLGLHEQAPAPPATAAPVEDPAPPNPADVATALRYLAAVKARSATVKPAASTGAVPVELPAAVPAAVEAPAPAPTGSVEDAVAASFGDRYDKALRVARCESSLNPNAVSAGGGNYGLFQINRIHRDLVEAMGYSWDQIFDPYVNAQVARQIFDQAGGWGPWGCRGA